MSQPDSAITGARPVGDLRNTTVVITGASSGMGRAAALVFALAGIVGGTALLATALAAGRQANKQPTAHAK